MFKWVKIQLLIVLKRIEEFHDKRVSVDGLENLPLGLCLLDELLVHDYGGFFKLLLRVESASRPLLDKENSPEAALPETSKRLEVPSLHLPLNKPAFDELGLVAHTLTDKVIFQRNFVASRSALREVVVAAAHVSLSATVSSHQSASARVVQAERLHLHAQLGDTANSGRIVAAQDRTAVGANNIVNPRPATTASAKRRSGTVIGILVARTDRCSAEAADGGQGGRAGLQSIHDCSAVRSDRGM